MSVEFPSLYASLEEIFTSKTKVSNELFCSYLLRLNGSDVEYNGSVQEAEFKLVHFINTEILPGFQKDDLNTYLSAKTGLRILAQLAIKYSLLDVQPLKTSELFSFCIKVLLDFLFQHSKPTNATIAKILSNVFRSLSLCINQLSYSLTDKCQWIESISITECHHILEIIEYCFFSLEVADDEACFSEVEFTSINFSIRDFIIRNSLRLLKSLIKNTPLFHELKIAQRAFTLFLMKEANISLFKIFNEYFSINQNSQSVVANTSRFEGKLLVQSLLLENISLILKSNLKLFISFKNHSSRHRTTKNALSYIPFSQSIELFTRQLFYFLLNIAKNSAISISCITIEIFYNFFPLFIPMLSDHLEIISLLFTLLSKDFCCSKNNQLHLYRCKLSIFLLSYLLSQPEIIISYSTILIEYFSIASNFFFMQNYGSLYLSLMEKFIEIFDFLHLTDASIDQALLFKTLDIFINNLYSHLIYTPLQTIPSSLISDLGLLSLFIESKLFVKLLKFNINIDLLFFDLLFYYCGKVFASLDVKSVVLSFFHTMKSFLDGFICTAPDLESTDLKNRIKSITSLKYAMLSFFSELVIKKVEYDVIISYLEVVSIFIKQNTFYTNGLFLIEYIDLFEQNIWYLYSSPCLVKSGVKALELFVSAIAKLREFSVDEFFTPPRIEILFQLIFKSISLLPSGKPYSIRAIGILLSFVSISSADSSLEIYVHHSLRILCESLTTGEHKIRWNSALAIELLICNFPLSRFIFNGTNSDVFSRTSLLYCLYSGVLNNIFNCNNFKIQLASIKVLKLVIRTYILDDEKFKTHFLDEQILARLKELVSNLQMPTSVEYLEPKQKLLSIIFEILEICK